MFAVDEIHSFGKSESQAPDALIGALIWQHCDPVGDRAILSIFSTTPSDWLMVKCPRRHASRSAILFH
jgi:hypothetical protein